MSIAFWEVSKAFGPKQVLENVSFDVETGQILFILGKSGAGKSVILKHIVGVMKPDKGAIIVDGQNVTRSDADGLADIRRRCGMVFQHPALLDSLTVYQNVSFGLRTPQFARTLKRPMTEAEMRVRVIEKLALVHLDADVLDRLPQELSYGMQKRVSLARTIAPEPRYLLFDEPTTGLDPITTRAVNDLISELSRKLKVTSIVVSHDMASALEVANRILVLDQAKVLAWGTIDEVKRCDEPLVRDFLSETLGLSLAEAR
ncbi:MAG: ATP-binding cassette domain-containing protein [Oligoflexia bacterium]|nr:ATP-binding cassette domain-containing protein [Oligoflexia bacterium]